MSLCYQSIVVLTGAGISAESGIKTFRAADGLWEDHRVEDVATPEGFARDPLLVHRFYNTRRAQLLSGVEPNAGHLTLAHFEQHFAGSFTLVTQNIDDLHERAGSRNVIHMHGELLSARCDHCQHVAPWHGDLSPSSVCPVCQRTGTLRPHVVWFGEMPLQMERIHQCLAMCDLFVSIGTSGSVYPAAGFFQVAKEHSAQTVELNLEASINSDRFDHGVYGPATQVVPQFFNGILKESATK